MADEYINRLTAFAAENNITDYYFGHRAKHRDFIFTYQGVIYRKTFPATGSDWRGPANAVSDLRHMLGLFKKTPPATNDNPVRRKRKPRLKNRSLPIPKGRPTTPVIPDTYYGPLQALKARFKAAAIANASGSASDAPSVTMSASEPGAASNPVAFKPAKVRIRTPWLGRRARYAHFSEDGFNVGVAN